MVVAGRHHTPRSGGPAVQRVAAGARRLVRDVLRRDPEDRWAAVFGRIAGYSFAVAVVTGVLLLPFFRPSMATVVYHGSCRWLDGATMSQAYRSVLAISFDVRGGLLIRQVHHWSADVFAAAVCLRLLRVVLPRPVLRPCAAGLADLGGAAATGHAGGLHRHHLARRRALRRQPERDHRRAAVRAGDRDAPGVLDLRRCPSRASDHRPRLLGAHPGPPGAGGRPAPAELPAVAAVAAPDAARSAAAVHLRGAGPARHDCADQPGVADTGRTSRAASAPARCRTGTWASSTAGCGSCRPGSCP